MINEPFRAVPELGLRERRREKGGENQLLCFNLDVFGDAKKGLRSQNPVVLWGGGVGGRAEGEIVVLSCVRGEREREKFKQQFNFMSAFTPLEWRRGK